MQPVTLQEKSASLNGTQALSRTNTLTIGIGVSAGKTIFPRGAIAAHTAERGILHI